MLIYRYTRADDLRVREDSPSCSGSPRINRNPASFGGLWTSEPCTRSSSPLLRPQSRCRSRRLSRAPLTLAPISPPAGNVSRPARSSAGLILPRRLLFRLLFVRPPPLASSSFTTACPYTRIRAACSHTRFRVSPAPGLERHPLHIPPFRCSLVRSVAGSLTRAMYPDASEGRNFAGVWVRRVFPPLPPALPPPLPSRSISAAPPSRATYASPALASVSASGFRRCARPCSSASVRSTPSVHPASRFSSQFRTGGGRDASGFFPDI